MNVWGAKVCSFVLVLALTPGAFELMENAAHVVAEGHLAHAEVHGDPHEPAGPEHGCTPIFHFCGCHASLAFLGTPALPAAALRAAGFSSRQAPDPQLAGFWPSIDRPPQA